MNTRILIDDRPRAGTSAYRRIVVAMVAVAVATFAQLWSVQPVLPEMAVDLEESAARVSLTVSAATGALAGFALVWSGLGDRFGRVRVIAVSLAVATLVGCVAPWAGDLWVLVVLRAVQGAALGGVPAAAVAYLTDVLHPADAARAVGIYIAGNPLGGMGGRLVAGWAASAGGWQWGVAAGTAVGVVAWIVFVCALPRGTPSARTRPPGGARPRGRWRAALAVPGMVALYAQALLLMGAFMTVYNLLGFRLTGEPFGLSQAVASSLFVAYTAGMAGSAWSGRAGDRWGPYRVLAVSVVAMGGAVAVLAVPSLPVMAAGLVVFTFVFFCAHATASAWAARRAGLGRAQASSLYTLAYYMGASLLGWAGGIFYDRWGWGAALVFAGVLCATALVAGVGLRSKVEALPDAEPSLTGSGGTAGKGGIGRSPKVV
ncbi:MFS transporter [Nocardiopsis sp. N85]|uniref:MFS transporter n=1 Tax=Nocardiopsis sp. N85 TaxID=3029400 RepID=UPI00237F7C32|nr:MFS transporter [Nocardiopsis sp. N85]MDE3722236.1 MFS transporter [Nocardiopsis sp. N85]